MRTLSLIRQTICVLFVMAGLAVVVVGGVTTVQGFTATPETECSAGDPDDMGCYMAAHPASAALTLDLILLLPVTGVCFGVAYLAGARPRRAAAA